MSQKTFYYTVATFCTSNYMAFCIGILKTEQTITSR